MPRKQAYYYFYLELDDRHQNYVEYADTEFLGGEMTELDPDGTRDGKKIYSLAPGCIYHIAKDGKYRSVRVVSASKIVTIAEP
jgi:hypothetical protein